MNTKEILHSELLPGEQLLWTGQPDPSIIFTPFDFLLVPFSLIWGGFAIFWEITVLGLIPSMKPNPPPPVAFILFGIPFVFIGFYFIVGRFFYKNWKKKKTWYAVTDRRILIVTQGISSNCQTADLDSIPSVSKSIRKNGNGNIKFGNSSVLTSMYDNTGMDFFGSFSGQSVPTFFDIKDAEEVYRLVTTDRK
jgi:hypothetical protein